MFQGDNQVLRGVKGVGTFRHFTAVQYSASASAVLLKYDIIIW